MESFMARKSVLTLQKDPIQGGSHTAEYQISKEDHPQVATQITQVAQKSQLEEDEEEVMAKQNEIEIMDYEDIMEEEEEIVINKERIIQIAEDDEQMKNSKPNKKYKKQNINKKNS